MERNGILAAGNFLVDHVKIIDAYPKQDWIASVLSQSMGNGGGPYNILKDLSKMGSSFPLAALGLLGKDDLGKWIKDDCDQYGIDHSRLMMDEKLSTSYTDVMTEQHSGRRTFFHQKGANAKLNESHFDFESSNHRIFYLAYFMLLDQLDVIDDHGRTGASRVLEKAQKAGMKTCADSVTVESSTFSQTVIPSLPFLDYYISNELEAAQITGRKTVAEDEVDLEQVVAAGRDLIELGVKDCAVIHFKEGAILVDKNNNVFIQPAVSIPQEQIKGSNGAGDAFAAGLLYAIHEGKPKEEYLKIGNCVAASCLLDETTSNGILKLEQCEQLMQQYGLNNWIE